MSKIESNNFMSNIGLTKADELKNNIRKQLMIHNVLTLDDLSIKLEKPKSTVHDNLKQMIVERIIGKKDSERQEIRRGRSPVVYFILPNIS